MVVFLKKLREVHGSIEQCVIKLKLLTADGISNLRRVMIVDATNNMARGSVSYSSTLKLSVIDSEY
jgi:hypothetical protein